MDGFTWIFVILITASELIGFYGTADYFYHIAVVILLAAIVGAIKKSNGKK